MFLERLDIYSIPAKDTFNTQGTMADEIPPNYKDERRRSSHAEAVAAGLSSEDDAAVLGKLDLYRPCELVLIKLKLSLATSRNCAATLL